MQDNVKELNTLIKGASTNSFKGFEEEGVGAHFQKKQTTMTKTMGMLPS